MIKELKEKFISELKAVGTRAELEILHTRYLGRKGEINDALKEIKDLEAEEKAKQGEELNHLKEEITGLLAEKEKELKEVSGRDLLKEKIDITAPGKKLARGHLNPRTIVLRQVENIFQSLGFSVVDGPEVETDWYNFEALNLPKDHPARDMQDTFYLKNGQLPRTHTSPVQVRFMEKNNPPLRIIVPGRVFRREATDATHDYQFYQVEGLMVDKTISVANFKAVIEEFFTRFYGQKVTVRLRPCFYPFTEPSFDIEMGCVFCNQAGCRVCSQTGWLEMAGAGMVNQKVFEAAGYVRNEWQGFAFGFGFERLVMMKYKINDIRLFNSGDLRFLSQF